MNRITRVALLGCTILLVAACAKKEEPAKDTVAAMTPAPAPPAPTPALALADLAGKWQFRSVPLTGKDTSATTWVLDATADTTGWTMTNPDKVTTPLRVSVAGDSVLVTTPVFSSQRRKGVKVKTETAYRLQDGKLVGITTAHYAGASADSVLQLRAEGTRMP
jgi:cytochrome oxidase assembly protein ShyY1